MLLDTQPYSNSKKEKSGKEDRKKLECLMNKMALVKRREIFMS